MLLRNDCAHITKNLLLVCKGTEQCKSELTKLQLTHSRSDSLTKCPNDQKTNERTIHHIKYIGRGYGKYTNLPSTLTLQFLPTPLLLSNTDHPQQPSYTKSLAKWKLSFAPWQPSNVKQRWRRLRTKVVHSHEKENRKHQEKTDEINWLEIT